MQNIAIIAQAVQNTAASAAPLVSLPLERIWQEVAALSWLHAFLAISFGVICLFYGWRIFRVLVVLCFGLAGLLAGVKIVSQFPALNNTLAELNNLEIWAGAIGFCFLAVISIPLMKWAVSILGAISGGMLTTGIWRACDLPSEYALAGAVMGVVAGGMISFIVFKMAVTLFTSVGGSMLVTAGVLSLLNRYEGMQTPPTANIEAMFYHKHWFLPAFLLIVTFIGMVVQSRLSKGSQV